MLQNHQSFKLERDQSPNSIVGNFYLKNTLHHHIGGGKSSVGGAPEDDSSIYEQQKHEEEEDERALEDGE